jgi:HSP20 family protein
MMPALFNGARGVGTVNRLFDRMLGDDFLAPLAAQPWTTLPLSVWTDENNVYVEFDAPGLTEKDIEVSVHDGILTISGERKRERQDAYDTRVYGRFEQRVRLPAPVGFDRAEAKLVNGVLCLTLPQSEEAKPRKIAIRVE